MIEIEGEHTTAVVQGEESMFDEAFFEQVQGIVDHEGFQNDIVIQPDGHAGAGAVIGFTMSLGDRITPNVVGSDIGCGVTAVNVGSDHMFGEPENNAIREAAVPMGLGVTHSDPDYHIVQEFPWKECQEIRDEYNDECQVEYGKPYLMDLCARVGLDVNNVIASMGTLGSGNHFFEISRSEETGDYWFVVHSGSRCVGGAVASYWQKKANEVHEWNQILDSLDEWMWEYVKFDESVSNENLRQWVFGGMGESFYDMDKIREDFEGEEIEERRQQLKSIIPDQDRDEDLDYLPEEFVRDYITDMLFAQQYARENRKEMIRLACEELEIEKGEMIDSIHNYIDFRDGMIRKGATRAAQGQRLVIPFNMAEGAVICRGKGNEAFNNSAPHGAGRRGSRRWARREFNVSQLTGQMEDIISSNDPEAILDEIPNAYKSSDDILKHLQDTAEVEETLTPVVNMKGE